MKEKSLMASLAVFGDLYEQKKDIHEVLAEFILQIIKEEKLHEVTSGQIVQFLREKFDFEIPNAIVKKAMNCSSLLKYEKGKFLIEDRSLLNNYDSTKQNTQLALQNAIIEKLFKYISTEKNIELTDKIRKQIEAEFCGLILDKNLSNGYSDLIGAFIVKNETDVQFISDMQKVREGVIIHTGLKYSADSSFFDVWKKKFTIYLNTESLFHLAGYNGLLHKELFYEFFNLIREINSSKKLIYLKYFKETRIEIDSFFEKAEHLIENKESMDPSGDAMREILKGCDKKREVILKKQVFDEMLKTNGIFEEQEMPEITDEENYLYNIDTSELRESMELDICMMKLKMKLKC